jgi:hypothetical protein
MLVRLSAFRSPFAPTATDGHRRKGQVWVVGLLLVGLLLGLWSIVVEPDQLVVRDVAIKTTKWPSDLPALRIAAVADLHAGALHIDAAKLDRIVDQVNAGHPDVIVLLGDFLIQGGLFGHAWSPDAVARHLARLQAPAGVFAVLGNHDWYAGGVPMWRALEAVGITVLENRAVPLPGGAVWMAGIADDTTRTPDPPGTIDQVPPGATVVAITHDPAVFAEMPPRVALTLAGHTHGGQVALPLLGPVVNASRAPLRHSYGHIHEKGADLYVSAGIGTSFVPIRFNRPPEIVRIRLENAAVEEPGESR